MILLIALQLLFATTPEQRSTGLAHVQKLEETQGMLFFFPRPQILHFWSKDCLIDLSVGFLDSQMVLREIHPLHHQPLETIHSATACQYALEVPIGWFSRNNAHIGDKLTLTQEGWQFFAQ